MTETKLGVPVTTYNLQGSDNRLVSDFEGKEPRLEFNGREFGGRQIHMNNTEYGSLRSVKLEEDEDHETVLTVLLPEGIRPHNVRSIPISSYIILSKYIKTPDVLGQLRDYTVIEVEGNAW